MKTENSLALKSIFAFLCLNLFVNCVGGPNTPPQIKNAAITDSATLESKNPTINVYLENSGSMFGYVRGVTEFEQSVYSYLSDINISEYCDSLNLNYINNQILKLPSDVEDFIRRLEPQTFQMHGGNLGTSDLSNIIGMIQKEQNKDDLAIFISDCVFSPGPGVNAQDYLLNQQIGIKGHVAKQLKSNPNYAIIVYRLLSRFNGIYYNCLDQRQSIVDNRPFYIWLMGDCTYLKQLTTKVKKERIKGTGVKHSYVAFNSLAPCSYRILRNPCIGNFTLDKKKPLTTIRNARPDNKGGGYKFQISIDVDFSHYLLDDEYLTNPNNYHISNNDYSIEIVPKLNSETTYSHTIRLATNSPIISRGQIEITLLRNMPKWIEEYTDNEGLDINQAGAMEKTYGLKYLIEGINDAYPSDNYATITINIE